MDIRTIEWKNNCVKIIDQVKLPQTLEYIYIKDLSVLWQAIKKLQVRGAPALGAAAGLGVYLGIRDSKAEDFAQFKKELDKIISYIGACRPTARNLFWGLERMRRVAVDNSKKTVPALKKTIFKEAQKIIQEDRLSCRSMACYGARLIKNNDCILTICNAGILATIDYGTALGVIYRAKAEGKRVKVFSCETRPLLQGARLTCWELQKNGVDVTLITDSMAAILMQQGKIDKVITGADRISANGDTANKVGTYNLAVLCRYHGIPFYIAAPKSTFDLTLKSGQEIPIEQRNSGEVTQLFFKRAIAPKGVKVFNPAFDVTPHDLISAIITDKGVIRKPFEKNIKRIMS